MLQLFQMCVYIYSFHLFIYCYLHVVQKSKKSTRKTLSLLTPPSFMHKFVREMRENIKNAKFQSMPAARRINILWNFMRQRLMTAVAGCAPIYCILQTKITQTTTQAHATTSIYMCIYVALVVVGVCVVEGACVLAGIYAWLPEVTRISHMTKCQSAIQQ